MRSERIVFTIVEVIFNLIELLLALRILLRFFGANPATPFVNWAYQTTQPLVSPFVGIFPNPSLTGGFVIDVAALVALVVYAIIGYAVLGVIGDLQARYIAHRHTHDH